MLTVPTIEEITQAAVLVSGSTKNEIFGSSRIVRHVCARHVISYLALTLSNHSLVDVAKYFSLHHTTIMSGRKRIKTQLDDPIVAALLRDTTQLAVAFARNRHSKIAISIREGSAQHLS